MKTYPLFRVMGQVVFCLHHVLRCTNRRKNGKAHRHWNVVENRRVSGGRVVQRQVLYLGEINGSQREAWRKTIEVFDEGAAAARTMALFPV